MARSLGRAWWALILLVVACQEAGAPSTVTSGSETNPSGSIPGEVLVIGDWGSGSDAQADIAAAMDSFAAAHDVEAILTTGDNFYTDDAERLLRPLQWAITSGVDFWVTWGNHDVESESREALVNEAFDNPPRWTTISWGEAEIVILDSTQVEAQDQTSYLEAEMQRIEAATIVVFHHPAYSCSRPGEPAPAVTKWLASFDDDVVLVLNGHDHSYQRFEVEDVTYVVSGGGGQALQPIGQCPAGHPPLSFGEEVYHFLSLTQDEDSVAGTVLDAEGNQIDSFTVPLWP